MKFDLHKICIVLFLATCTTISGQITQGTLYYSMETVYDFTEKKISSEPDTSGIAITYTISSEFNPKYIRSTTTIGGQTNIQVTNRTTNEFFVALCSTDDHSVRYYKSEKKPSSEEEKEKEKETKLNPDSYHENFYEDLMEIPLKDTIVIQTNETKTISGYSCKKTLLKIPDGDRITIWTTDQLPGLEEFGRLHSDVKGTMVSENFISEYFRFKMELLSLDSVNKINEKELIPFPEGFLLELGTTYLNNGDYSKPNIQGFELPDFIDYSGFETALKKINGVLYESKEMKEIAEELVQDDFLKLELKVNEYGNITSLNVTLYEEDVNNKLTATIHQLQTKCNFKPITVYDKDVPFQFHIFYHFPN